MPNPNSKFQFSPLFTLSRTSLALPWLFFSPMKTFTVSSLVAASMLLAACGSAGSDTAMDPPVHNDPVGDRYTGILNDATDSALWVPGEPDTLIVSNEILPGTGGIRFDFYCSGLSCANEFSSDEFVFGPSFFNLADETAFNQNGLVNGPTKRTIPTKRLTSSDIKIATTYDYWMGDSMFSVVQEPYNNLVKSFGPQYSVVLGNNTGSRPSGTASYTGKTVAITTDNTRGRDLGNVHHGLFNGIYNFRNNTIGLVISFPDIRVNTSFEKVPVSPNGSFSVSKVGSSRELDGAFFGRNHNEVAGTYFLEDDKLVGSFGGIKN